MISYYYHLLKNLRYLPAYLRQDKSERTQEKTCDNYNRSYERPLDKFRNGSRLSILNKNIIHINPSETESFYVKQHYKIIKECLWGIQEEIKILEIGMGYGKILFPLSCLFPYVSFHGVDFC